MEFINKLIASISDPFTAFFNHIVLRLPSILGAFILLLIGLILSRVIREILERFFSNIKLDELISKTNLTTVTEKLGLGRSFSKIFSILAYWFILLIFIVAASNAVGLYVVGEFIKNIFDFIPKLVASIIILGAGFYLAGVVKNIVYHSLTSNNINYAKGISLGVEIFIYFLSTYLAMSNILPKMEIIGNLILILFAGIAIAFGIAFGLAGKDLAEDFLRKLFKK
ncbi:MAG: hypothetical protein NZ870_00435 [bacterium]|nr:hypothetical protein [bacterium]